MERREGQVIEGAHTLISWALRMAKRRRESASWFQLTMIEVEMDVGGGRKVGGEEVVCRSVER